MNKPLHEYIESTGKTRLIFDFDETIVKLVLPWEKVFDPISKNLASLDKTIYDSFKEKKISVSETSNKYCLKYGNKARTIIIDAQTRFEKEYLRAYLKNDALINFIIKWPQYTMFIWSSNTKPTVINVLRELGIMNRFKKIINREDVAYTKPYTDGFKKLYEPMIPKNKYVFIGDSKNDKNAAQNVGIDFYYIDYFNVPGKYW